MGFLRFFLATAVFVAHAGLGLPLLGSTAAVFVFFCISGFLITLALCSERYTQGHWLAAFYLNRSMRIWPLYWITLAATILVGAFGIVDIGINFSGGLSSLDVILANFSTASLQAKAIILFTNATTVFQDVLLVLSFDPRSGEFVTAPRVAPIMWAGHFEMLGQSWSLGTELMFYLVAPLLVRRSWNVGIAAAVCGIIAYAAGAPGEREGLAAIAANLHASFQYLPFFLFGSALCHLFVVRRGSAALSAAAAAIALCALTWTGTGRIGSSMIYVVALASAIPLLFTVVKSRVDDFFGELSYPLYITHFLVLQACRQYASPEAYPFVVVTVIIGGAVAATFIVERPVEQFRHALGRRLTSIRVDRAAAVS